MIDKVKQVLLIRTDLNMRKGKMIAQGAHASMAAILNLGSMVYANKSRAFRMPFSQDDPDNLPPLPPLGFAPEYTSYELKVYQEVNQHVFHWLTSSFTKVALQIPSLHELLAIVDQFKSHNPSYPVSIIHDTGGTDLPDKDNPTITAAALGPAPSSVIDPYTGHLKLL